MLKFTNSRIAEISIRMVSEQICSHLRLRFPEVLAKQPGLSSNLDQLTVMWLEEAMAFGVVNEPDVKFYVQCKVMFGQDFALNEKTQWAIAILQRSDLDGETKMDQIDEYMLFGLKEPV